MPNELHGLVPIVVVGVIGFMMLLRGRLLRGRSSSATTQRPRFSSASRPEEEAAARDVTAEILRSQIDFHEFARELQARLDNKLSALQALVLAADRRIAELERLRHDAVVQGAIGRGDAAYVPHFGTDAAGRRVEHPSEATSRYAAIYALADAGHGAASIAARLGEPIGEIELVLSLRKRVPSAF